MYRYPDRKEKSVRKLALALCVGAALLIPQTVYVSGAEDTAEEGMVHSGPVNGPASDAPAAGPVNTPAGNPASDSSQEEIVVAAGQPGRTYRLCEEDEYFLGTGDNNMVYAYDADGRIVATLGSSMEGYSMINIKNDMVYRYELDNTYYVFSFKTMSVVAEYPVDSTYVLERGRIFVAISKEDRTARFCDNEGNVFFEGEVPFDPNEWNYYNVNFLELSSGYVLYVGNENQEARIFYTRKDGSEARELTDTYVRQTFLSSYYSVSAFGDYLHFHPYDGTGTVFTIDGEVLLSGLTGYEYNSSYDSTLYGSWGYDSIKLVYIRKNQMVTVYDPSLAVIGTYTVASDDFICSEGFAVGTAYGELGGRLCEGFVRSYDWNNSYPYAREGNTFYVWKDEKLVAYVLFQDEYPEQMNSTYMVTYFENIDGRNTGYVRKVSDGSIFTAANIKGDGVNYYYSLGKSGMVVSASWSVNDDYFYRYAIFNENLENTYTSEEAYIYPWGRDLYYMSRGIYTGITDAWGNWIFRSTYYEE